MANAEKPDTLKDQPEASPPSRRALIAGIAALVGGALMKAGDGPAEAVTGQPIVIGVTNSSDGPTTFLFGQAVGPNAGSTAPMVQLQSDRPGSTLDLLHGGDGVPLRVAARNASAVQIIGATVTAAAVLTGGEFADLQQVQQVLAAGGGLAGGMAAVNANLLLPAVFAAQGGDLATLVAVTLTARTSAAFSGLALEQGGVGGDFQSLRGTGSVGQSGPAGQVVNFLQGFPAGAKGVAESEIGSIGASGANVGTAGVSLNGPGGFFFSQNSDALVAQSPVRALRAMGHGLVEGDLTVLGNLFVTLGKFAAVRHPDGSHRLLHAVESPEAWFEDFGRGELRSGRARVALDPDFRAVVSGDYHVFLTPEADCNGLYVEAPGPTGFEVRELRGGTSDVPFTYRVVAKRADLATRARMERMALPTPAPVEFPRPF